LALRPARIDVAAAKALSKDSSVTKLTAAGGGGCERAAMGRGQCTQRTSKEHMGKTHTHNKIQ